MMIPAALQIGNQLRVRQRVRSDGLQLAVSGNRRGFAIFVPIAKVLSPQFLRENLFCALEAFGNFGFWSWQHLVVAKAVHIPDLKTVDKQSIKPGEIVCALLKGG